MRRATPGKRQGFCRNRSGRRWACACATELRASLVPAAVSGTRTSARTIGRERDGIETVALGYSINPLVKISAPNQSFFRKADLDCPMSTAVPVLSNASKPANRRYFGVRCSADSLLLGRNLFQLHRSGITVAHVWSVNTSLGAEDSAPTELERWQVHSYKDVAPLELFCPVRNRNLRRFLRSNVLAASAMAGPPGSRQSADPIHARISATFSQVDNLRHSRLTVCATLVAGA